MFIVILVLVALINIFSSHLLAIINNVSVWWHVIGSAAVVLILWSFPTTTGGPRTCSPAR